MALGLELYGKTHFVSDTPRFSSPNKFDVYMRDKIWVGLKHQDQARAWSDRLIYGVSMSSLLWGPLLAENPELALLINARVFAANSIMTNIVKIGASRERPYSHYQTRVSEGKTDYTSFYSGHSSVAFSQAVSNAMILSRSYPQHNSLIWSTFIGTAGVTAILRVRADMHYFSDILTGALSGSVIAWLLTRAELRKYDKYEKQPNTSLLMHGTGSNFVISIKIPLG
jgi:membrane-associated phospholipid phosphatase